MNGAARRRCIGAALLIGSGLLIGTGLLIGLFLWVDSIAYRHWPADAQFSGGGQPHVVTVGADETFILWKSHFHETPECSVVELPSGKSIPLDDVTSEGWLRGAGAVHHLGFARGRSGSASVSVSCEAQPASPHDNGEPDSRYFIDEPDGPAWLDGFGPWWPGPVALVIAGLGLVAVSAVLRVRPARDRAVG